MVSFPLPLPGVISSQVEPVAAVHAQLPSEELRAKFPLPPAAGTLFEAADKVNLQPLD